MIAPGALTRCTEIAFVSMTSGYFATWLPYSDERRLHIIMIRTQPPIPQLQAMDCRCRSPSQITQLDSAYVACTRCRPVVQPPAGRHVARATWTAWLPAAAHIGVLALLACYAATLVPGGFLSGLGRLLPALLVLGAASAGLWWWSRRRHDTQLQQAMRAVVAIGDGRTSVWTCATPPATSHRCCTRCRMPRTSSPSASM